MTIEKNASEDDGLGAHFLWHLELIGCLERDDPEDPRQTEWVPSPVWDEMVNAAAKVVNDDGKASGVKVAIIDNGCCSSHPNLDEEHIVEAIDFSSNFQGTVYGKESPENRFSGLREYLSETLKITDDFFSTDLTSELRETILQYWKQTHNDEEAKASSKGKAEQKGVLATAELKPNHLKDLPAPAERFAAHGTSCAGLVAGHRQGLRTNINANNPSALPYVGVNPYAKVIPISTAYSHAYWPLVMALLYATANRADVILIPRAVEEMEDPNIYQAHLGSGRGEEADPRANGNLLDRQRWADKLLFEKLLAAISADIPVVVAAGNSGTERLTYPASLVGNGIPDLIVVGAATALGSRATYSAGFQKSSNTGVPPKVTTYGPSDDRQETSKDHFRFFDLSWRSRRIKLDSIKHKEGISSAPYSPYGIFAIDIPGQYGYATEGGDDFDFDEARIDEQQAKSLKTPEAQPRALYTLFGGTSAACSVVAGVVSLIKADNRGRTMKGPEIKDLIAKASVPSSGVFPSSDAPVDTQDRPPVLCLNSVYDLLKPGD